jgi:hypothetical protein
VLIRFKEVTMKQRPPHARLRYDEITNFLLFPRDSAPCPETLQLTRVASIPESPLSQAIPLSLAQVIAEWQLLLKRLGRRRRVLETVLAAGQPIQLTGHTLVVGFSPQRPFYQELLDMPDYRGCVEEELARMFQVRLSVVTALYPERRHLSQQGPFWKTPA